MIIYHRRERPKQRVFTPEEYSSMGYMQNENYDASMFAKGSYSSFKSFDINFLNLPVYRADTKEEFATDAFMLLGSFATGGSTGGLRFAISKLERES